MSDSNGYVVRSRTASTWTSIKQIKEVRARPHQGVRGRSCPAANYHEGCKGIWTVKCDIALPCATQNELDLDERKGAGRPTACFAVAEGANMPSTLEATEYFQEHGVLFAPGKAANAGGVATSALEMSQNSMRLSWTFEEVDEKLNGIMIGIYKQRRQGRRGVRSCRAICVVGANIAGFLKIADAMMAQGV